MLANKYEDWSNRCVTQMSLVGAGAPQHLLMAVVNPEGVSYPLGFWDLGIVCCIVIGAWSTCD